MLNSENLIPRKIKKGGYLFEEMFDKLSNFGKLSVSLSKSRDFKLIAIQIICYG